MSKKKIGQDIENLTGINLPDDEGNKDLTEVEGKKIMTAPVIPKRKTPKGDPDKGYRSFRMRARILREMEEIAEKENVPFTGQLIHNVLENFIENYKQGKIVQDTSEESS